MTIPLVVVGAGGFGRETLDVVEAINAVHPRFEILGVVDVNASDENVSRLNTRGVAFLGTVAYWLKSRQRAQYLLGIGNPVARAIADGAFVEAGLTAAIVVHPTASIGSLASLGEGTVVCGGVQVSTNVSLGRHVHLNPNSTIGHDTVLNDFVSINPAATISGDVTVGSETLVGAGAVVLQGLTLMDKVTVGASACVVHDVAKGMTVKGIPAK